MFMSDLFLNLFNRATAAGWVVLAVLLLRLVLKKAPRWVHCGLWGLVGLRLVWPFSWESVVSLLPSREVLPPEVLFDPTPAVHTGIGFVNTAVNGSFTPAMTAQAGASVNPLQIWTWLAGWIWAVGAAALVGYALFSFLRLRKRVAVSVEEQGLWRCDAIDSPFILGLFRPRIYVPSDLSGEALAYVSAHEQAHLKRKDHWWKPLGYLLLTVFWFHPLLWVGYVLLCRDIEMACDETVVRDLDEAGKRAYSLALVDCAVDRRAIAACPVAFGEVGVRQRVKSVLHYKKPAFWMVAIAVVLCVAAAVCFLTDPVAEDEPSVVVSDPLADGSAYISDRCVYMIPYSSQWAGEDSGYYYYIDGTAFNMVQRKAGFCVPMDLGAGRWQPLPFTQEQWAEKFLLNPVDIFSYTDRRYLPLDEVFELLYLDGELWIVCNNGSEIWSIHALKPVDSVETARWSYMEGVDSRHRPMVLQFGLDFDRLHLDCDVGQIFGATTNVNYEEKLYYSGQTELIYWTPLNEDGTTAPDRAEITFSVWKDDAVTAEGVLTIDRQGNCGIQVKGSPVGTVFVKDSDFSLLFTAELPAAGPKLGTDEGGS